MSAVQVVRNTLASGLSECGQQSRVQTALLLQPLRALGCLLTLVVLAGACCLCTAG
jgi:hypothetical protein